MQQRLITPMRIAATCPVWLAIEATSERADKPHLDRIMLEGSADHGLRLDAVKLVAQLLVLFPTEELFRGHWLAQGDVHGSSLASTGARSRQ